MFLETLHAKFGPALVDVVKAIPARDNSGTFAFSTEIAAIQSIRVPGMTLVEFARRHFGTGTLRKVGEGMYAVLRAATGTPANRQPIVTPIRTNPAPVFPSWAYHV